MKIIRHTWKDTHGSTWAPKLHCGTLGIVYKVIAGRVFMTTVNKKSKVK